MIIYYHCTRGLVTIIFTNLPSLHPLSFHEMIFILVYIQLTSQCMIINYFLLCVFRIVVEEEQTSHVQQLNSELLFCNIQACSIVYSIVCVSCCIMVLSCCI